MSDAPEAPMKPSDELRRDHQLMRAELSILERHLQALRGARSSVSRLSDSLASCLRFHTARQERLLARLASRGNQLSADTVQHLHDEHENQRTRLAVLHEFLARQGSPAEDQLVDRATEIIQDLKAHIAHEEEHLLPVIDRPPHPESRRHEPVGFLGVP